MAKFGVINGGAATPPDEPVSVVVLELEGLLAAAKAGTLRGIAYATCYKDGEQGTGWAHDMGYLHIMGTSVMMLNFRYAEALFEDD